MLPSTVDRELVKGRHPYKFLLSPCAAVEGSVENPRYQVEPCGMHGSQSNGYPVPREVGQCAGH